MSDVKENLQNLNECQVSYVVRKRFDAPPLASCVFIELN